MSSIHSDHSVKCKGHLQYRGKKSLLTFWHKYYFICSGPLLKFYKSAAECSKNPGISFQTIDLSQGYEVSLSSTNRHLIYCKHPDGDEFILRTKNENSLKEWLNALSEASGKLIQEPLHQRFSWDGKSTRSVSSSLTEDRELPRRPASDNVTDNMNYTSRARNLSSTSSHPRNVNRGRPNIPTSSAVEKFLSHLDDNEADDNFSDESDSSEWSSDSASRSRPVDSERSSRKPTSDARSSKGYESDSNASFSNMTIDDTDSSKRDSLVSKRDSTMSIDGNQTINNQLFRQILALDENRRITEGIEPRSEEDVSANVVQESESQTRKIDERPKSSSSCGAQSLKSAAKRLSQPSVVEESEVVFRSNRDSWQLLASSQRSSMGSNPDGPPPLPVKINIKYRSQSPHYDKPKK